MKDKNTVSNVRKLNTEEKNKLIKLIQSKK
ncbi:hypothetical protein ESCOCP271B_03900 [Escherichia coli]|jgi:hypothetical protein